MARVAREIDYAKIDRLKKLICSDNYISLAINYIAQQITSKVFEVYN